MEASFFLLRRSSKYTAASATAATVTTITTAAVTTTTITAISTIAASTTTRVSLKCNAEQNPQVLLFDPEGVGLRQKDRVVQ